jgi:D-glucosaminate-6-phosphate ammonia-lyase
VVETAHAFGRPVLVDAAACLPPLRRLQEVVESGADLVAVSGGKALGGPQNSGLLIANESWIKAAALQNFDWDLDAGRFAELFGSASGGLPVHGVGRGFKVSKETVMGLVAAVERFVAEFDQIQAGWTARLDRVEAAVRQAGVSVQRLDDAWGGPVVLATVGWPKAAGVADRLRAGSPRIEVGRHALPRGLITISPLALRDEDVDLVVDRLEAALTEGRDGDRDPRGV